MLDDLTNYTTPIKLKNLFFNQNVLNLIVREANRFALIKNSSWVLMNTEELKIFLNYASNQLYVLTKKTWLI